MTPTPGSPGSWRTGACRTSPQERHHGDGFVEAGLAGAVAVVCAAVEEIHTLETALRIRELRPDVRS